MTKELLIYADESAPKGRYFSNFYGGALVCSSDIDHVQSVLEQAKIDQNMLGEIKWSKVTDQYLGKYQAIMELFFDLIERDLVKLRIMFTQNMNVPTGLTVEQQRNSYFLLYYQFIKNAFGLPYSNSSDEPLYVRLFFDRLPSQKVQNQQFKDFIFNVQQFKTFKDANIHIRKSDIVEVNSHDHVAMYGCRIGRDVFSVERLAQGESARYESSRPSNYCQRELVQTDFTSDQSNLPQF